MTDPWSRSVPLSAPDLVGPVSILNWPIRSTPSARRGPPRPFAHVRFGCRLSTVTADVSDPGLLAHLARAFGEETVAAAGRFGRLVAATLHAFASQGYRRVDHWETVPGGWLPLGSGDAEPLAELARALESTRPATVGRASRFSARLSSDRGDRAELTIRRRQRAGAPALVVDVYGTIFPRDLHALIGALQARLPIGSTRILRYALGSPARR